MRFGLYTPVEGQEEQYERAVAEMDLAIDNMNSEEDFPRTDEEFADFYKVWAEDHEYLGAGDTSVREVVLITANTALADRVPANITENNEKGSKAITAIDTPVPITEVPETIILHYQRYIYTLQEERAGKRLELNGVRKAAHTKALELRGVEQDLRDACIFLDVAAVGALKGDESYFDFVAPDLKDDVTALRELGDIT